MFTEKIKKLTSSFLDKIGHVVALLVEALSYEAGKVAGRFPIRSLDFSVDLILPTTLWPWD
jgi:hypothetical protein